MSENPETHTCDCGFTWLHGRSGAHQCEPYYRATIKRMKSPLASAIESGQDTTGLCTVRECVAMMKADGQTTCEMTFGYGSERVHVMVSLYDPIQITLPPITDVQMDELVNRAPSKIWLIEPSPDEKLVAALKQCLIAFDNIEVPEGGLNGYDSVLHAEAVARAALAAAGAKEE